MNQLFLNEPLIKKKDGGIRLRPFFNPKCN